MRIKRPMHLVFPILSMILMALLVSFPYQPAHATGSIVQAVGSGICTSACSVPFSSNVTTGHEIVVFTEGNFNSGCSGAAVSPSDSLGTGFTSFVSGCDACSGDCGLGIFLSIGQALSKGADTVFATLTGTPANNGMNMEAFELITPANTYLESLQNNLACGGCGTAAVTPDKIVLPSSYFEISAIVTGTSTCSSAIGGQTQYIWLGGASCWFNIGQSIGSTSVASGIEPSVTSPTNFPWTAAQTTWALAGVVFALKGTALSVVTVPCTAFQLQCWLYPLFVFGIYMVLVLGLARALNVPLRDYSGHFLEAFSLASLVMVIWGILNVMPAMIITVVQIIRAVRE